MELQTVATAPPGEQTQYLTFCIASEEYAVGVLHVKEIIQYESVTRVPSTPPWIRGVINLRGGVVPVIDLAVKFGLGASATTPLTCIVIVELNLNGQSTVMGILADSVRQVVEFGPGDIQPPPPFGARVRVEYLVGMGTRGQDFALVLDIDRVLSSDELLAAAATEDTPGAVEVQPQPVDPRLTEERPFPTSGAPRHTHERRTEPRDAGEPGDGTEG